MVFPYPAQSTSILILIQSIETDSGDTGFCVWHCCLFSSRLLTQYASATENTWYTTAPEFFILIQGTATGNRNIYFHVSLFILPSSSSVTEKIK